MLKPFAQAFAYLASNYTSTPVVTAGTSVTGGNSANGTQVAWGGGALGFEGQLLIVEWYSGAVSNTDTRSLIDVLIDPAGGTSYSSTPLVSGLLAGFGMSSSAGWRRVVLPVRIPSGAALGLQARSLTTGRTHIVVMRVFGGYKGPGTWRCGSRVISIGVDEANYNGTLVTPGASGAWGSWTSVPAATTTATNLWAWNIVYGGVNGNSMLANVLYLQVGAGSIPLGTPSATNEPHLQATNIITESVNSHRNEVIFADVPEGTQMQVRAKVDTTSPQNGGVALYAVTG